jgi:hypothetical protein
MVAAAIAAVGLPCPAATITFNPFGTGSGVNAITGVSGFGYSTSSFLDLGQGSLGSPGNPSTGIGTFYTESVVNQTIGASSTIGANFSINGSPNQFTMIQGFQGHVVSYDTAGTVTLGQNFTPGFSTSPSAPNFFEILAIPAGTVSPSSGNGAGFGSGTPILTGHFIPDNFSATFTVTLTGGAPMTGPLNVSGLPTAIPSTTQTQDAGGGGQRTIQVDTFNPLYFPVAPSQLLFTATTSLPFASVAPLTGFYNGPNATPNITYPGSPPSGFDPGAVNGALGSGNSLVAQTVGNSSFIALVPEPSGLILGATAALGIPAFLSCRRRWTRKSAA